MQDPAEHDQIAHASFNVWHDLTGEGYWAELDTIRVVLKKDDAGWWHKWLVIPSSGGASYHAFGRSLTKAKSELTDRLTECLKNAYGRESTDSISLSWHPIGTGGRFVILSTTDILSIEECNPGGELECAQDHAADLVYAYGSRAAAEHGIAEMVRRTDLPE